MRRRDFRGNVTLHPDGVTRDVSIAANHSALSIDAVTRKFEGGIS